MSSTGTDRVVLITGAGGGLGRGLVAAFARAGWRVAAGQRRPAVARETESVWPVELDVTRPGAAEEVVEGMLARWGRLDVLVNNAGVVADRLLAQLADADWDRVLGVNLGGAMACSRAALRPMLRQRWGHIINIGSQVGRVGAAGQTAYASAKAGLLGLTQSLAAEVASHNVRVNIVLPGVMGTPMTAGLPAAVLEGMARANLLGRLNAVEEVAGFVVFLAGMVNVSAQVFQLDSRPVRWG